jgi:hypothetical protein
MTRMAVHEILAHLVLLLALPPLLVGVIQKVKALFAGRKGAPLLQPYHDLWKLLRKGAVISRTTTWVFRAGPMVVLATALVAGLLVPLQTARAPLGFEGDVIAFAYLFGLARFFTMAAALDTGSSFEGMGASREAAFSPWLRSASRPEGRLSPRPGALCPGASDSRRTPNCWPRRLPSSRFCSPRARAFRWTIRIRTSSSRWSTR